MSDQINPQDYDYMTYLSEYPSLTEVRQQFGRTGRGRPCSVMESAFRLAVAANLEDARHSGTGVVVCDIVHVSPFDVIWFETVLPGVLADFESFAANHPQPPG
jgi:hypothetical protein